MQAYYSLSPVNKKTNKKASLPSSLPQAATPFLCSALLKCPPEEISVLMFYFLTSQALFFFFLR